MKTIDELYLRLGIYVIVAIVLIPLVIMAPIGIFLSIANCWSVLLEEYPVPYSPQQLTVSLFAGVLSSIAMFYLLKEIKKIKYNIEHCKEWRD